MKIDRIASWTADLERVKHFHEKYFQITAGKKYFNPTKNFD